MTLALLIIVLINSLSILIFVITKGVKSSLKNLPKTIDEEIELLDDKLNDLHIKEQNTELKINYLRYKRDEKIRKKMAQAAQSAKEEKGVQDK